MVSGLMKGVAVMSETILLGRGRQILEIPREMWEQHLAQAPQHSQARLSFMSPAHHQVRYFVVRELPGQEKPIAPEAIARALQLPRGRVETLLDELERKLFFLVRNQQGAVAWAYPVTVEPTPHRLTFSTGERVYAA
jgi:hypothetical protein